MQTRFYDASGNIDLRAVDCRKIAAHAHRLRARYQSQVIKRAFRALVSSIARLLALLARGLGRFVSAFEFRANKARYRGPVTVRLRSDQSH